MYGIPSSPLALARPPLRGKADAQARELQQRAGQLAELDDAHRAQMGRLHQPRAWGVAAAQEDDYWCLGRLLVP